MDKQKGKILAWGEVPRPTNNHVGEKENLTKEEATKIISTSLEFLSWLVKMDETRFNVLFILFQLEKGIEGDKA